MSDGHTILSEPIYIVRTGSQQHAVRIMLSRLQEAPLPSQVEPHAKCGATILTEVLCGRYAA